MSEDTEYNKIRKVINKIFRKLLKDNNDFWPIWWFQQEHALTNHILKQQNKKIIKPVFISEYSYEHKGIKTKYGNFYAFYDPDKKTGKPHIIFFPRLDSK